MSDVIEREIEQIADQLEKSHQDPRAQLFDTIRRLGPEGIRAKLPTLQKSDQELLVSALSEMKKAVEMDKDYAAKYVQGKVDQTIIQEDKADDNQDEKLVKPEAAAMPHQGTPTDGWEGQVIKGKTVTKDKAKDALLAMEEKEHGTKDPKKLVEAEKKEQAMKKGEDMNEKMKDAKKKAKSGDKEKAIEGLKEMKKALELANPGASPELIKGEMQRMLAEESQDGDAPAMNEATRANKESVAALELGKDSKDAQKKVNDEKQGQGGSVKKAVWGGENDLIKAGTYGRNFHFSYEGHVIESAEAVLKSVQPKEDLKKSEGEPKKDDLNDIIAKSQDATWDHFKTESLLKANASKRGALVKSFADNEIAQALGLTEEEAKKILGE